MTKTLYPVLQAPVIFGNQNETVMESKFHQGWSEPVRTRINGTLIALIASGAVISPFALTQPEAVMESKFHYGYSEPVRFKRDPRASIALMASGAYEPVYAAEIEPGSKYTPWFTPLSEPVWPKKDLKSNLQLTYVSAVSPPTNPTILVSSWFKEFADPVWHKRRLEAGLQQADFLVQSAPFNETVYYDKWGYAWSEPVRVKQALQVQDQDAFEVGPKPEIDISWYNWFAEPVRFKPGLHAHLQWIPSYFVRVVYSPGNINLPLYTQALNNYPANYWMGRQSGG